jgi:hypothetical protein
VSNKSDLPYGLLAVQQLSLHALVIASLLQRAAVAAAAAAAVAAAVV